MANAHTNTVEDAIAAFHSEVKLGPEFVCICCHRMMYRKSVVACNKVKYTKTSTDVLHKVFSPDYSYISFGGKEWICKSCDRALRRGCMPVQASSPVIRKRALESMEGTLWRQEKNRKNMKNIRVVL